MRVLLIEDDRMIGTAIELALKDAAYAVDWVTDGETAVHAVEKNGSRVGPARSWAAEGGRPRGASAPAHTGPEAPRDHRLPRGMVSMTGSTD